MLESEIQMESDVDSQPTFNNSDLPQQLFDEGEYSQENNVLPDANTVEHELADTSHYDDEVMINQESEPVDDTYPYEEDEEIINAEANEYIGEEDLDEYEEEDEEIDDESNMIAFKGQPQYDDVCFIIICFLSIWVITFI